MLLWSSTSNTSDNCWHRAWFTWWYMVTKQKHTTTSNRCLWYNWVSRRCTSNQSSGIFQTFKTVKKSDIFTKFYCYWNKNVRESVKLQSSNNFTVFNVPYECILLLKKNILLWIKFYSVMSIEFQQFDFLPKLKKLMTHSIILNLFWVFIIQKFKFVIQKVLSI